MLLGSIEAGGTKFICAVGDESFKKIKSVSFPTTTPVETLNKVIDFFRRYQVDAIGIGSFGPVDVISNSKTYGYITSTPKKNWKNTDILNRLKKEFNVPMYFTTDVNSSAYGEMVVSKEKNIVYFTIGTGIGAGGIQDGYFIGGISHAEMGHQFVKRHLRDEKFKGICPFHGDCLEGLASGPSLEARLGISGEKIPEDSEVWDIQAYYIAQAVVSATLTLAPQKIIIGGGVMNQKHMIKLIRKHFNELLNDYVILPPLEEYIQTPSIPDNGSATVGNFALALKELEK